MASYEQRMQNTYSAALGTGWTTFSGLLLMAGGVWWIIEGIAGLAKNNYFGPVFFWGRPFWGAVVLVLGGVALYAGFALLNRMAGGRLVGIVVAAAAVIINLMVDGANQTWAQAGVAMGIVLLYGLVARGEGAAPPAA
jgi:hypothetical protein